MISQCLLMSIGIILLNLVITVETISKKNGTDECTEEYFSKKYNTSEKVLKLDIQKYRNKCNHNGCKDSFYKNMGVAESADDNQLSLNVTSTLNPGCMMYIYRYRYCHNRSIITDMKLIKKCEKGNKVLCIEKFNDQKLFYVDFNTPYVFELTALPSGKQILIEGDTSTECTIRLQVKLSEDEIFEAELKSKCPGKELKSFHKILKDICSESNEIISNASKGIHQKLFNTCSKKHQPKPSQSNLIIGIFCGVLLILICLFFTRKYIYKLKKQSISTLESQQPEMQQFITRNRDTSPTVMILHRPGCELLDSMMQNIACVLQSYGIKIKLALLEQCELDAEGGISSYLQRNIDSCDYILIMFTRYSKEFPLSQHKPFEFALNVITGLMCHHNDTSRYISMYTDSYKKSMCYIPSLFQATQDYGYRIPHDILKLIQRINGESNEDELQHQERKLKDKHFIDNIKETKLKLECKSHEQCHKSSCEMGNTYASVTNLSSVWATTIQSKTLSSSDSVLDITCRRDDVSYNEEEEVQDAVLKVKLWKNSCGVTETVKQTDALTA